MRSFIAIELPDKIKTFLSCLQEKLKRTASDVKWVEPRNIHLTLKFLGEIPESKLPEITAAVQDIAQTKSSFVMRLAFLGAFPNIKSCRVIWVGIDKGDTESKEIALAMEEKLQKSGIPGEERKFSSHITLGRARGAKNRQGLIELLDTLAGSLSRENLEFEVKKLTLFKSTLTPQGPVYETVKFASLKTA